MATTVSPSEPSLESIWLQHYDEMVSFARSRMSDSDDAEDVVQESFVRALERGDLHLVKVAPAYLTTIIRRLIVERFRKSRSNQRYLSRTLPVLESTTPYAGAQLESEERDRLLNEAMASLPKRQRAALELRNLGMKPAAIARMQSTGEQPMTANQVSCLIERGLRGVETHLKKKEFVPSLFPVPAMAFLRTKLRDWAHRLSVLGQQDFPIAALALAVSVALSPIPHQPRVAEVPQRIEPTIARSDGTRDPSNVTQAMMRRSSLVSSQRLQPSGHTNVIAEIEGNRISYEDDSDPQPSFLEQLGEFVKDPDPDKIGKPWCTGLPQCPPPSSN